jgi:aryl-alcohol dehydrogenase-like predicted oxidoreductase
MGLSWPASATRRDDDRAIAVLHSALDNGVTFFDTADIYGDGHNEAIVGRALRKDRHDVTLATKVGLVAEERPGRDLRVNGTPQHIRTAVDASLYRLGDSVIDLYYLHRVDPQVPLAETWGAMASLVERGKVRWLGLAEVTPEQAAEAHAIHPVTAVQAEFSLWSREPLEMVEWCREQGVAFVPFAPLGRGFLNGAVSASDGLEPGGPDLIDVVRRIAGRHRVTPAQVALAWTLAQGEHVVAIPGTNKRRYLEENVGAARVPLTAEDLGELAVASELTSSLGRK